MVYAAPGCGDHAADQTRRTPGSAAGFGFFLGLVFEEILQAGRANDPGGILTFPRSRWPERRSHLPLVADT
jgi:hypothetical protein